MKMSHKVTKHFSQQEEALHYPSFTEVESLSSLSRPLFTLRKKSTLVNQGDPFQGLYIVHSGMLKQNHQYRHEEELLTHLYLPKDVIGLDAMGDGKYTGTVSTIETSGLCLIPFRRIDDFPTTDAIHMQLLRCLSKTMCYSHARLWQILSQPSDVRVACFFMTMSYKFRDLGYSSNSFRLPMSRQEIAHYLCMASETVSRIISRFQHQGLLAASGHEYCILNPEGLISIAEHTK